MEKTEPYLQVGVKVLLENLEGKFLLVRRNPKKYPEIGPKWDIVGGRIDIGTTLLENLAREVNIFHVKSFNGEPQESEEMRPQWFNINELPLASMWPDDEHWLPLFLKGQKFKGHFIFDGYDKIIEHSLEAI